MPRKRVHAVPEDVDRLRHIAEFCARLRRHAGATSSDDFLRDEGLQDKVIRCLIVIGEAAANLSDPARGRVSAVPWASVVALRHLLVHSYERVEYLRVWVTATRDIPRLHAAVESALASWPRLWGARDNSDVRVLLTAAGVGSRLRPLTDRMPKCLVPIAGRPLLDYWFDAFEAAGIRHVLINTHHLPEQVRDYLRLVCEGGRFEVQEAHEPRLLGSAGTITANKDFVPPGREALIIYSDNLSSIDLAWFLAMHRSHADPFTMLLFRAQFPEKSGIAELAPATPEAPESGPRKVLSFVEKPKQPRSDLANAGLYAMTGELWHEIAAWHAFDIGFDVIPRLVGRMHAIEHTRCPGVTPYHRDIGTLESLAIAEREAPTVFGARPPRTRWAPG